MRHPSALPPHTAAPSRPPDENKIYGCVCDSSWEVGYGPAQLQEIEWFGVDCSMKHCPSGDDPRTSDVDETDCEWADANGATWRGYIGTDGVKYKSVSVMPPGVSPSVTPAPTTKKYGDSTTSGDVVNAGGVGNKCHVECSNRGTCDYGTGTCACFRGYAGSACQLKLS